MRENERIRPEGGPKEPDCTIVWRRFYLAVVLVVAFLPLTPPQEIGVSSGLIVAAEIFFWDAALFVGGAVISRYRRFFALRAWFRKG